MRVSILKELLSQLERKEIAYSVAYEKIKALPKVWYTKEWKKLRDELIKDICENCKSKDGPMVLQHLKQPDHFYEIFDLNAIQLYQQLQPDYLTLFQEVFAKQVDEYMGTAWEDRDGCPTCGSVSFRIRKNMTPKFVCGKNHGFDETIKVRYYKNEKSTNFNKVLAEYTAKAKYFIIGNLIKEFIEKYQEDIGRLALMESINQSIEYSSMINTITLCKKCAFKEDYMYALGTEYGISTKMPPFRNRNLVFYNELIEPYLSLQICKSA